MTDLEYTLSQIPHFDYVHEHLFCSGQPSAEQRKHPANTALPSDPISLNLVPT